MLIFVIVAINTLKAIQNSFAFMFKLTHCFGIEFVFILFFGFNDQIVRRLSIDRSLFFNILIKPYSGNIYKMSRNKDRYESSNARRQQIFMSQEDVAAGRKSNWTGVEITGTF